MDNEQDDLERQEAEIQRQMSDLEGRRLALQQRQAELKRQTSTGEDSVGVAEDQSPELDDRRRFPTGEAAESAAEDKAAEEVSDEVSSPGRRTDKEGDEDAIFARLRELSLLRDDSPTEPAVRSDSAQSRRSEATLERPLAEPRTVAPPVQRPAAPAPRSGHSEEESIDQYMERLLARLNGGRPASAPESAPAPATTSAATAPEVDSSAEVAAAEPLDSETEGETAVAEPELEPQQPWDPSTMSPHRAAPESTFDMRAMRELANLNANSAIGASVRRRLIKSASGKASVAVAGLLTAGVIYRFSGEGTPAAHGAMALASATAVYWLSQTLVLMRKLRKLTPKVPASLAAESGSSDVASRSVEQPAQSG